MSLLLIGFLLVAPFWVLMIAVPRWGWTTRILQSWAPLVPISALYGILILLRLLETGWVQPLPSPFGGLSDFMSASSATLLWVHTLAFDLFVARWIYLDGRQMDLSVWLTAALLIATFILGPLGLLLYLAVRARRSSKLEGLAPA